MTEYVVGFAFWRNQVLLIHKKKGPSYVVGKLNGVGGKIETGETIEYSMVREFMEETAVETWATAWEHVATMRGDSDDGDGYVLHILYNFLPDYTNFSAIENPEPTGETLEWIPLDNLSNYAIVENIKWIIPLCLDSTTPFLNISEG